MDLPPRRPITPKNSSGRSRGGRVRWVNCSYSACSSRVNVAPAPSRHLATTRHAAQVGPVRPQVVIASVRESVVSVVAISHTRDSHALSVPLLSPTFVPNGACGPAASSGELPPAKEDETPHPHVA